MAEKNNPKPTPTKSAGGRAPRLVAHRQKDQIRTFPDHASNPVLTYVSSRSGPECHPVSLQVYTLAPLAEGVPLAIARGLLSYEVARGFHDDFSPRVDFYSPMGSLEECMAHQRAEKVFRRQRRESGSGSGSGMEAGMEGRQSGSGGGSDLYMIPTWQRGHADFVASSRISHRNLIFVLDPSCTDFDSVLADGLNIVLFDWVDNPEVDIEIYSDDEAEESLVQIETIPPGSDPLVLRGLLRKEQEAMLHREWDALSAAGKWEERTKDTRVYFGRFFWDMAFSGLPQCYQGMMECGDCEAGVVHERCTPVEWVLPFIFLVFFAIERASWCLPLFPRLGILLVDLLISRFQH